MNNNIISEVNTNEEDKLKLTVTIDNGDSTQQHVYQGLSSFLKADIFEILSDHCEDFSIANMYNVYIDEEEIMLEDNVEELIDLKDHKINPQIAEKYNYRIGDPFIGRYKLQDVNFIMSQTDCSIEEALIMLDKHDGDVINAILSLTPIT